MRITTLLFVVLLAGMAAAGQAADEFFTIQVIDEQTGRGVPLVELRTVNEIVYVTDSNGLIAFREPGLMDQRVFFHVKSHGYEFPRDGFGYRGKALDVTPGGSATLKIKRINIAERLYRVTGQGIYRDSALVGRAIPLDRPNLNGKVAGQDSVHNAIYQGKLFWFWGDTSRPAYPLGHFRMAGAVSDLPESGGLDPRIGVNLQYFVNEEGFSRPMAPMPHKKKGLYWLDGFFVVQDEGGRERMVAHANRMKSLEERYDHALLIYDDPKEEFVEWVTLKDGEELHSAGQTFEVTIDGQKYFYFARPDPLLRVEASWDAVQNPQRYESFTCLAPGTRWKGAKDARVERDGEGNVVWNWKANTSWMNDERQKELIDAGKLLPGEKWIDARDAQTGKEIILHHRSVAWNAYRGKWIMIASQVFGSSMVGEVWYLESDRPHGPYRNAVKIVTHDDYSFYNPRHHPYFDQEGGRFIYFEGTYTQMFSGAKFPTPRYDYNQVMYRLDLADPRLKPAQE